MEWGALYLSPHMHGSFIIKQNPSGELCLVVYNIFLCDFCSQKSYLKFYQQMKNYIDFIKTNWMAELPPPLRSFTIKNLFLILYNFSGSRWWWKWKDHHCSKSSKLEPSVPPIQSVEHYLKQWPTHCHHRSWISSFQESWIKQWKDFW